MTELGHLDYYVKSHKGENTVRQLGEKMRAMLRFARISEKVHENER